MLLISLLLSIGSYFYPLPCNIFFYSHRVRVLSESDTIYNLSGQVGCTVCYGSWKDIWTKYSGRRECPSKCRVLGCSNDSAVGHVGINKNQRYYILPMCNTCSFTKDNVIKVKANSAAVPVFKRDVSNCENCYPR